MVEQHSCLDVTGDLVDEAAPRRRGLNEQGMMVSWEADGGEKVGSVRHYS